MSTVYADTVVPVARSQESIRQLLIKFGARGVQFSEDFGNGRVGVKFGKAYGEETRTVSVAIKIPEPRKPRRGRSKPLAERWEQQRRRTYRAMHDWLKASFVAVEFGLMSFEDIFLSHFEWMMKDGSVTTIGSIFKPQLLSAPKPDEAENIVVVN